MRSLRPSRIPGTPGSVAPIASSPGAVSCAKYHTGGAVRPRCGSFASSGLPLALRLPLTTQLFDPAPSGSQSGSSAATCCIAAPSARASPSSPA
jgi:hypothetical protein